MNVQQAREAFRGPMVSVATPFAADGEVDLDRLGENIRFMVDGGVKRGQGVLLVAAAGGEFPMLSMEERKAVIEASVEAACGEVPVAASIQFNASRHSAELARHAGAVGAVLGQLSSPYYYEPSAEDVYEHFRIVTEESDLPIMIYSNWWVTDSMDADMVERLATLDNVVVVKWSAPTPEGSAAGIERLAPKLALVENGPNCVAAHRRGGVGFITHVSNFWPGFPLKIWSLLNRDAYDEAQAEYTRFKEPWNAWKRKVIRETEGEGPFIKAAMDEVGLMGGAPRAPARSVSEGLRKELHEIFVQAAVPRLS